VVTSRISQWNTLEGDLLSLHNKLIDLGVEYHNGKIYLSDLGNITQI